MKNFHLTVSIDRPNTGVDTVLDQAGEFTPENLQVVSSTIQTALGNFENEADDVKYSVSGDLTDTETSESVSISGNATKGTILSVIAMFNSNSEGTTQTTEPAPVEEVTPPVEETTPPVEEGTTENP